MITGYCPDPPSGLYLSVASSVPSRIGTWMVSQTTPGNAGLVTGAAPAAAATPNVSKTILEKAFTRIGPSLLYGAASEVGGKPPGRPEVGGA